MELVYNILYLVFLGLMLVAAFLFLRIGDRLGGGGIKYFDYDKMNGKNKGE